MRAEIRRARSQAQIFLGPELPSMSSRGAQKAAPRLSCLWPTPGQAVSLCSVFLIESGLLGRPRDGGQDCVCTHLVWLVRSSGNYSLPSSFCWSPSKHIESPNS